MTGEDRPLAPSGWYPDPRERGRERYWDGSTWSEETRALQPRTDELPASWRIPDEPTPAPGATAAPRPGAGPRELDPFEPVGLGRPAGGPVPPASTPPAGSPPRAGQPTRPGESAGQWHRKEAVAPGPDATEPARRPSASFGARAIATVVDYLLVNLLASLVSLPFLMRDDDFMAQLQAAGTDFAAMAELMATLPPRLLLIMAAVQFVVWFAYGGLMLQLGGATLGQRLMGLRTVTAKDDSRLGANRAWGRSFAWALLMTIGAVPAFIVVPAISCFRVLFSPTRQTLHDALLGTRVVSTR